MELGMMKSLWERHMGHVLLVDLSSLFESVVEDRQLRRHSADVRRKVGARGRHTETENMITVHQQAICIRWLKTYSTYLTRGEGSVVDDNDGPAKSVEAWDSRLRLTVSINNSFFKLANFSSLRLALPFCTPSIIIRPLVVHTGHSLVVPEVASPSTRAVSSLPPFAVDL